MLTAIWLFAMSAAAQPAIEITGMAAGENATVVLVGSKGQGCRESAIVPAARSITALAPHVDPGCWPCPDPRPDQVRLAVLSRGHAVAYRKASDVCGQAAIAISLQPRLKVPVTLWVKQGLTHHASGDAAFADSIFEEEKTGITLDTELVEISGDRMPVFDPDAAADQFCEAATNGKTFRANRLNVYYGSAGSSFTCGNVPVVRIQDAAELGDLAHELGHAMGLLHVVDRGQTFDQGHTNGCRGFDCRNRMWVLSHMMNPEYSLGQAFWIGAGKGPAIKPRPDLISCLDHPESCVPLAIADARETLPCNRCTLKDAKRINPGGVLADPDLNRRLKQEPRFCTQAEVSSELRRVYQKLAARAPLPGLPPLANQDAFRRTWLARFKIAVTVKATSETKPEKRARPLRELKVLAAAQSPPSAYLSYAIDKLSKGETVSPSCSMGHDSGGRKIY